MLITYVEPYFWFGSFFFHTQVMLCDIDMTDCL